MTYFATETTKWSDSKQSLTDNVPGLTFLSHIDGLVQERRYSSALTMELRLSCFNPSIYWIVFNHRMVQELVTFTFNKTFFYLGTTQRHFAYLTHYIAWFNQYIMWTWSSWICIGGDVHNASVRHCSKLNLLHLKLIRWITPTLIHYLQSTWWIKQHAFFNSSQS